MTHKATIWKWDNSRFIVEVFHSATVEQIKKWSFASPWPSCGVNHYRRQFFIPAKKVSLAKRLLGIKHTKNPNRVKAGKQAANNHPVRRGEDS